MALKEKVYLKGGGKDTDREKSQPMMILIVNHMISALVEQSDVRYFLFIVIHKHSWKPDTTTTAIWMMPWWREH